MVWNVSCDRDFSETRSHFSALKNVGIVEISSIIQHEVSPVVFLSTGRNLSIVSEAFVSRQTIDTAKYNLVLSKMISSFVSLNLLKGIAE